MLVCCYIRGVQNCQEYKNANFANIALAVSFEIN